MKDFTLYPEAFELKKLGFDEPCIGFYKLGDVDIYYDTIIQEKNHKFRNNTGLNIYGDLKEKIAAPTYSQAFRFFRDKFNMPSKIEATFEHETPNQYHYFYQIVTDDFVSGDGVMLNWTYEEAELACLKKLIEIVKTNEIS